MDAFEIQVYDATALPAHAVGLELHSNAVIRGEPSDTRQTHFTLEPAVGIFSWWEMGAYFQTAFAPDGTFRYAGTKIRSKWVTPPKKHPRTFWEHFRFGLNGEFSLLPVRFDPERWGVELRPLLAWENADLMIAANPNLDFGKSGASFQPAAAALWKIQGRAAIGVEYYGSFEERVQQYLFPVVNVLAIPHVEINFGGGIGLTTASNRFIAKMILGYAWD
jgi:hypothetical protein